MVNVKLPNLVMDDLKPLVHHVMATCGSVCVMRRWKKNINGRAGQFENTNTHNGNVMKRFDVLLCEKQRCVPLVAL